jgi:hypothetical protein
MKTTAEYLELAQQFELLAMFEQNPNLKADFEKQAVTYRRLAAGPSERPNGSPKISN